MAEDTLVDFAVVAFREDGQWQLGFLPHRAAEDLHALVAAVRQQPSESATLAMCSYGDDFFLILRPEGEDLRVMVSDATAASDYPIVREALELTGESPPVDPPPDTVVPGGDLDIVADLGLDAMELAALCTDPEEPYPDELLGRIAARIGFGPQFDRALDDDLT